MPPTIFMKLLRYTDPDFAAKVTEACAASSLFDPAIDERVRSVLADVQSRGDAALIELTQRFDGAELTPATLPVTEPTPHSGYALQRA